MPRRRASDPANLLRGFPPSGETGVEKIEGGGHVLTGAGIAMFRFRTLLSGLELEIIGLKLSRGPSSYSILKSELGLKGNKQKVYDQAKAIYRELYPLPTR
jgi:hypothetical protein